MIRAAQQVLLVPASDRCSSCDWEASATTEEWLPFPDQTLSLAAVGRVITVVYSLVANFYREIIVRCESGNLPALSKIANHWIKSSATGDKTTNQLDLEELSTG